MRRGGDERVYEKVGLDWEGFLACDARRSFGMSYRLRRVYK